MPVSNRAHRKFLGNIVQYPISCYSDFDVTKKNNQGASLYFIRHLVTRVLTLVFLQTFSVVLGKYFQSFYF